MSLLTNRQEFRSHHRTDEGTSITAWREAIMLTNSDNSQLTHLDRTLRSSLIEAVDVFLMGNEGVSIAVVGPITIQRTNHGDPFVEGLIFETSFVGVFLPKDECQRLAKHLVNLD
ncbi:MAG: hypothetical protein AAGD25_06425 [Cyanobacteria bacterium P01_F01_bin.150]